MLFRSRRGGWKAAALGIAAGALFGLSAIGFRGAILSLPFGHTVTRAATILALGLALQSVLMLAWLALADRAALAGIARHWRGSLGAGALGALASLFWFIGFALTAAATLSSTAQAARTGSAGRDDLLQGDAGAGDEAAGAAGAPRGVQARSCVHVLPRLVCLPFDKKHSSTRFEFNLNVRECLRFKLKV